MAYEEVALGHIAVAVAQGKHALALVKDIARDGVLAGFDGDNLHLAVAAVEEIVGNLAAGVLHALLGCAHADGFGAVRAVNRPGAKVVMVYTVVVLVAVGITEHHDQRNAQVEFTGKGTMVYPVAAAVEVHIAVVHIAPCRIAGIYHALGEAASGGEFIAVAELHQRALIGHTALQEQAPNFQSAAADMK